MLHKHSMYKASINGQIKGGLMVVNQRIDLVQEQIDTLWQIAQLGCEWKVSGLCVTSVYYNNYSQAANLSKELSSYLTGNWSRSFDSLMKELRVSITMVNSPRVDALLAEGFSSWILQAMSHLKEWAGRSRSVDSCPAGGLCSGCVLSLPYGSSTGKRACPGGSSLSGP